MKNITYILLTSLLFLGCTQEKSSDKTIQVQQPPTVEKARTKKELNATSTITPIIESVEDTTPHQKMKIDTNSQSTKINTDTPKQKLITEEIAPEALMIEEEKDTTPPPSKSQEELADEAQEDSNDTTISEEDDETGFEKPTNELEDEATNTVDYEGATIEEETITPTKSIEELQDEQ